jgi:hypothetical protein
MSVPVDLEALRAVAEQRGPLAYLITVGGTGPHVVSARVAWDGDRLVTGAGRTTTANVAAQPRVTLLWPAGPDDEHSLLVDGDAEVADGRLALQPDKAILHRRAGDDDGPRCEPVA